MNRHTQHNTHNTHTHISCLYAHLPSSLDLSHNCLSDSAGRALGKLLNGHCQLECLDVSDNDMGRDGGSAIGHALEGNTTLRTLNLRLNK